MLLRLNVAWNMSDRFRMELPRLPVQAGSFQDVLQWIGLQEPEALYQGYILVDPDPETGRRLVCHSGEFDHLEPLSISTDEIWDLILKGKVVRLVCGFEHKHPIWEQIHWMVSLYPTR